MEFDVIQGDIARQTADAIVTAAGSNLMMDTGGTGTALLAVGGEELGRAAVEAGPIERGEVAVTDAYDLDADHVVHAAAAVFGGNAETDHVREATRNALAAADDLGCASIALPAIGCGGAGLDITEGGRIVAEQIRAFEPTSLEDAALIGYTDEEYAALRRIADA